ncbi:hypothetical protein AB0P02_01110 [Streptomyces griseoluteus]|uniref:hypothetical protein n=1 Tax=Streptomyces griseoluteus TaxID=29306 RepID=UPI00344AEE49
MTGRLYVLGDDGAWREVPGIASVEFDEEQPDDAEPWAAFAEQQRLTAAYVRDQHAALIRAYMAMARPVMEEASRRLAAAARAFRDARVIDQDDNPIRRPDRPAWQSPYGPARRRR